MTLRPALAALLLLAACPGPQESGADASATPGKDAAPVQADATSTATDAARTDTDAARTDMDAGLSDASTAPAADAASQAGADATATAQPDAAAATLGVLSVADLWAVMSVTPDGGDKGFLLINVHVPYEGNIPGTDANLTYENPDAIAAFIGSDLDRPAVVYCKSNSMSTLAGNALAAKGYRAIRYLDGGFWAWKTAGHPMDP